MINISMEMSLTHASLLIISSICATFFFLNTAEALTLPKNASVPAVIVFGDSIVDPGNNNYINTIIKCDFPPYGRDFMGGTPTGRFGNGRVPSDMLAEEFGVKKLLPAYLDPSLHLQDLLTGVSFASGGSGYDPITANLVSVLSLDDQLKLFDNYMNKIKTAAGENRAAEILSQGIFLICIGSDDIANTYFSTTARRFHYDINSYTDLMLASASSFIQNLYGQGARRIGIIGIPPVGCVPSQRTLEGGILRKCSDTMNQAAQAFNSKLSSEINSLRKTLPDSRLVYLDVYNTFMDYIRNPAQYGFQVVNKGCCGTGNIEVSILCNQYDPQTCQDASSYIFWDSYHPSEKAYSILVPTALGKEIDNFF